MTPLEFGFPRHELEISHLSCQPDSIYYPYINAIILAFYEKITYSRVRIIDTHTTPPQNIKTTHKYTQMFFNKMLKERILKIEVKFLHIYSFLQ